MTQNIELSSHRTCSCLLSYGANKLNFWTKTNPFFKCSGSFALPCLREFGALCLDSSPQQQFMVFDLQLCPSFPVHGVELTLPKPQTLMLYASLPTSQAVSDCSSHSECISSHRELGLHPVSLLGPRRNCTWGLVCWAAALWTCSACHSSVW